MLPFYNKKSNEAKKDSGVINKGNIISVPNTELTYKDGIGTIIFQKMSENKEKIGQIDGITGEEDSYGSMLQRSIRTAITMRSKGITSDDIVTVCSFNHLNTNIPIIASFFLKVKTACTDPTISLSDTIFLLNQVRPKMIFVSPDSVKLIEDTVKAIGIDPEIVVFGDSDKHTMFSEFLKESPEELTFRCVDVTDLKETATILFSSGTSGMPKGICLTHLCLLAQIPAATFTTDTTLTYLGFSSPYWISSILFLMNSTATSGCRLMLPSFDSSIVWDLIDKYQVFMMYLAPSQLVEVLSKGRPSNANTSSLKMLPTGGSPLSEEQIRGLQKLFPTTLVSMFYGQTELGGGAIAYKLTPGSEDIQLLLEKPTSSGRPISGREYKIVDPETEEILGVNQEGELRIKTEYQMNGYYNIDSSNAWDSDGFVKTGDIAYFDEDYCFYIVDRIKEMLKYKGYQIAPAKLEGILMTHPAVECAVVIGLPHPADCDHPMAIIVLNKFGIESGVAKEEIENYLNERVDDRQKLRGGSKIVERLPVTITGKFSRRHAKNLVLQGQL